MGDCETSGEILADVMALQRQGNPKEKGQEGPQDWRHRRQEAANGAQEDECAAHPGY